LKTLSWPKALGWDLGPMGWELSVAGCIPQGRRRPE
jgi:hypothetical protein